MNKVIEFIKKPISVKTFIIVSIFVFLLMCSSLTLQEYKTTTEGWLTTKADIDYSITRYFQAPIIIFYLIFCFKKVSNLRCVCYPVKIFVNAFNIFGWYYPDIAFPALLIPYIFILLLIMVVRFIDGLVQDRKEKKNKENVSAKEAIVIYKNEK